MEGGGWYKMELYIQNGMDNIVKSCQSPMIFFQFPKLIIFIWFLGQCITPTQCTQDSDVKYYATKTRPSGANWGPDLQTTTTDLQLQTGGRTAKVSAKVNAGAAHGPVALLSHPRSKLVIQISAGVMDTPLHPRLATMSKRCPKLISCPDSASQAGSRPTRCEVQSCPVHLDLQMKRDDVTEIVMM